MVHLVIAEFGDSQSRYGRYKWVVTVNPHNQGLGQVNGADPDTWSIVINPLLK